MDILFDPNVAYLLLAGGVVCAMLALLTPGTGALEIAALFALLLSGVSMYNLPINLWALIILLVGATLFVLSLRSARLWYLLVGAILALVIGSAFMFRGETWWQPAVNPMLAATISLFSGGFFWISVRKTLEARSARPNHDLGALIGQVGEAKTAVHEEGSVQVAGELWSARSASAISIGERVRVTGREGFVLDVEPFEH